jgi:DNA repair exonuclease SbcCD ATPase subunit
MALAPDIAAPEYDAVVAPASRDPIDKLPSEAAEKLRRLRRLARQASDHARPASERHRDAREAARRARDAYEKLSKDYERGAFTRTVEEALPYAQRSEPGERARRVVMQRIEPDTKRLERERRDVERLEREAADLEEELHAASSRFQEIAGVVRRCESWLVELPPRTQLRMAEVELLTVRKGETPADCAVRLEQQCRAISQQILDAKAAPSPSGETIERITKEIHALAAAGVPDIFETSESGAIAWPTRRQEVAGFTTTGDRVMVGHSPIDAAAVLCWLHRDAIIEKLSDEIRAHADDASALSRDDRQALITELSGRRLGLERQLEQLYEAEDGAGRVIFRLEGIAPPAVLGVEIVP